MRAWLLLLPLAACSSEPKPTDAAPLDSGGDSDVACTAEVTAITPADGASDVDTNTEIVATFSAAGFDADITIVPEVAGTVTLAADSLSATFVADGGLADATDYVVTASACGDTSSAGFTTAGVPLAVDLTGHTYDIELDDPTDLVWVAPSFGELLVDRLATTSVLFMVEAADTARIDLVGAAGYEFREETAQYPCTYAFDFPAASFTDHPDFEVGPLDTELSADGIPFDLYALGMSATLAEDGSEATDVVLTGLLDTRPLSEGLGLDVCALAESLGDLCVDCPDGETGCLTLEIHDARAPWREGVTVDPDQDPTTDRYCD